MGPGDAPVMHEAFGELRETWDADDAEPITDFIDAGDCVVARFIWRGTGHGPAFRFEVTAVYILRRAARSILGSSTSGITPRPSKPWGYRTSTRLDALPPLRVALP